MLWPPTSISHLSLQTLNNGPGIRRMNQKHINTLKCSKTGPDILDREIAPWKNVGKIGEAVAATGLIVDRKQKNILFRPA
jgi:hypothetical protein